jgi:hypothetical protein
VQLRNVEHATQQLYGDQRRLGKMKVAVLGAIIRKNRQLFSAEKNPAIDQMATDNLVVIQVDR